MCVRLCASVCFALEMGALRTQSKCCIPSVPDSRLRSNLLRSTCPSRRGLHGDLFNLHHHHEIWQASKKPGCLGRLGTSGSNEGFTHWQRVSSAFRGLNMYLKIKCPYRVSSSGYHTCHSPLMLSGNYFKDRSYHAC